MTELAEEVEVEESEVEVIARQHGWVPQDEFTGDETNWVDAEKWESRSKRERLLETELARFEKANEQAAAHLARLEANEHSIRENAEKTALEKLKATIAEGVAEGDAEKAGAAADEYAQQASEQKVEPYMSPADMATKATWLEKYPQYQRADISQSVASISAAIIAKSPGLPIQQVLDETHKTIVDIYKEYFVNEERDKPAAVESGGQRLAPKKEAMPAEFKKAMNEYADNAVLYGMYKPGPKESIADAKKRAREGYMNSYKTMETIQ